jgi:hypothetical protein
MNDYQKLWWEQARSDHAVLMLLRREGAAPCHQLHYLQMVTEKLSKAFFWQKGKSPPEKKHFGFNDFLKYLTTSQRERRRIADIFAFGRFDDLQNWIRAVWSLNDELKKLAPACANDGPNAEYPWPHTSPQYAPATFAFGTWTRLVDTGRGRQLLKVIDVAVARFPEYSGG